jgi:hypothetical protein
MDEQKPVENKPNPASPEGLSDSRVKKSGPKDKQKVVGLLMFEAGTEFAFLIAAPLIGGVLLGKWLDTKTHHNFFVIIGILLAIVISSMSIYKRIKDYKNLLK